MGVGAVAVRVGVPDAAVAVGVATAVLISVDIVQPFLVLVDLAADRGEVRLLIFLGDPSGCPAPTGRSSTARIGTTSAAVPVRKASSAR